MSWAGTRPLKADAAHPYAFNDHGVLYVSRADLRTLHVWLGVAVGFVAATALAEYLGRRRYPDFAVPHSARAFPVRGHLTRIIVFAALAGATVFAFSFLHRLPQKP
jgi:hypothetical protein